MEIKEYEFRLTYTPKTTHIIMKEYSVTHIIMKGYERVLCPTARDPLLGELAGQAAGSEPLN